MAVSKTLDKNALYLKNGNGAQQEYEKFASAIVSNSNIIIFHMSRWLALNDTEINAQKFSQINELQPKKCDFLQEDTPKELYCNENVGCDIRYRKPEIGGNAFVLLGMRA